jgi:pimeloyl-ACP methyl ester carboxylesterase
LTWRKQIDGLSTAGFHVVAPDMRGYNTSDKPEGIHNYSLDLLIEDVIGIADHFNQKEFTVFSVKNLDFNEISLLAMTGAL